MTIPMTDVFQSSDPARFERALRSFDAANSQDPNSEPYEGKELPRELVYALRLTDWVLRLRPRADEALRLAARCQHLCRWMIPRQSYPMTRAGYLKWREALKHFHASKAGEILTEAGYPPEMVARVQTLNLKKHFPQDPDSRVLEDALCLTFIEWQFAGVASGMPEEKIITVLRKTWHKMTKEGHAHAMQLGLAPELKRLLQRALAGEPGGADPGG